MVWPKHVPVFTIEDIVPPPAKEYEDMYGRKTVVGWLKELFLYYQCEDDPNCIQIRPEDRKDYDSVIDKVKKLCKIKENLHDWEMKASRTKQVVVLNRLMKKLGYREIYYDNTSS
jgi:hypothetical protein